jgi:tape measure domain-containing protein
LPSRISELIVKIGANSTGFERELSKAVRELESTAQRFSRAGLQLSAGLTLPIAGFAKQALTAAGSIEALRLGLTAVTRDTKEANRQFESLREVAKLPGLGFEEAARGAVNLQAVGFSAQQSQNILLQFGNALASVGRGRDDLNEVIRQLGQLGSRGVVTADNLKPIIERVPQVAAIIKKEFGTIDTEALQKLGVSSRKLIQVLLANLEELPRVTGGINNDFENLSDTIKLALADAGQAFAPFARTAINAITPLIGQIADVAKGFATLSPAAQSAIVGLTGLAAVVGPISLLIGQLKSLQGAALSVFAAFAGPQGILYASGAVLAIAAAAAIPELIRLDQELDDLYKKQQLFADQQRQIANLKVGQISDEGNTRRTIAELQALAKSSKEVEAGFKDFGKSALAGLGPFGRATVTISSSSERLKEALGTLGVENVAAQLSKVRQAMEDVRAAFAAGEVDIGTLNRATKAYDEQLKKLGVTSSTIKPISVSVDAELISRQGDRIRDIVSAVTDNIEAAFIEAKRLATVAIDLNPLIDAFGGSLTSAVSASRQSIRELLADVEFLGISLGRVARIDVEVDAAKDTRLGTGTVFEAGQILGKSQVDFRREAEDAGRALERIVELRDRDLATQQDVIDAQQRYAEASARAAGIVIRGNRQQISNLEELKGNLTQTFASISGGIAGAIVQWRGFGDVVRQTAQGISASLIKFAIDEGLALLGKEIIKLGGLFGDLGRTIQSVFSGASTAAANTAGSVAQNGPAAAVSSGVAGTVGAIGSVATAAVSTLMYLQLRRIEQDVGRIEPSARGALSELMNIRRDAWDQFNQTFTRLGEIWQAQIKIYEGLGAIDFGRLGASNQPAATAPISITINAGATSDPRTLSQAIVRELRLLSPRFA